MILGGTAFSDFTAVFLPSNHKLLTFGDKHSAFAILYNFGDLL
jgi:hypothetical protein